MHSSPILCGSSLALIFPQKFLAPFRNSNPFANSPCFNSVLSNYSTVNRRRLSPIHTAEIVVSNEIGSRLIDVGYISSVHGLQGEVRVKPNTDFPELRFSEPGRRWLKQQVMGEDKVQEVELVEGRGHPGQKSWIVKFSNIDKVEQAQQLVGSTMLVSEDDRPELEEDEFYSRDLVGMRVIQKETGEPVGTVVNVFNNGANDLLHILLNSSTDMPDEIVTGKSGESPSGPLVWIPFVEAIVPHVDMSKREMLITPPKGLLELNVRSDERSKKERRQLEWKERKKFQKRLIAAKKKLCELEQKHVFDGFKHGEKAQGRILADQIIGVNSKLLQVALQNMETSSKRWNLSEFMTEIFNKQNTATYKISEGCLVTRGGEYAISKVVDTSRILVSEGKVGTVLIVNASKKEGTQFIDSEAIDMLLQSLKVEDRQSRPLVLVCPANEIRSLEKLFSDNNQFSFDPKKVWFLEEEKLPVVSSSPGENDKHKILMKSPWEILQAPVGSGGVISLLSSHNILECLSEMGVEYIEVCNMNRGNVYAESLLGLVDSFEAYVGILSLDRDNFDDDLHIVFSMKFMKQLTQQINKLHFHAITKPNPHVEKVGKEWLDILPSFSNSIEFHCSIYSCLNACPSEKVCVLEVSG